MYPIRLLKLLMKNHINDIPHIFMTTLLETFLIMMAFCLLERILGKSSTIHSPPVLFFFFKAEIRSRTVFHSLDQNQC